jgi:hypothetical protein
METTDTAPKLHADHRWSRRASGQGLGYWLRRWSKSNSGCRSGTIPSSLCPEAGASTIRTHGDRHGDNREILQPKLHADHRRSKRPWARAGTACRWRRNSWRRSPHLMSRSRGTIHQNARRQTWRCNRYCTQSRTQIIAGDGPWHS